MIKLISSLAIFLSIAKHFAFAGDNVVCYVGTWAHYRTGAGKFTTEKIDPNICTHLIYSFLNINYDGSIIHNDEGLDIGSGNINKFNDLKKINPKLKTLAAIGGWNAGSEKFSAVANTAALRETFAANAVKLCLDYGFDGIDMDWEYPAQRNGRPEDKKNFVLMLEALNSALKKKGLLLTVAVAATEGSASISYDIPAISKSVDFINLMGYDFHGSWEGVTGQNAPLGGKPGDKLNLLSSIDYWLKQGAPANKLNVGLGLYGRSFTLSGSTRGVGAPAAGPGKSGQYTNEAGFLGYNEICENIKTGGWAEGWDNDGKTPFAFKDNQWVGYDNEESIRIKCNEIKKKNLAGGMFWSIETDDFLGKCGPKFPLVNALRDCLKTSGASTLPPTSATARPTLQPTVATTSKPVVPAQTPKPKNVGSSGATNCEGDKKYRDPSDCSRYIECVHRASMYRSCPAGLYFNENIQGCDYPANVQCS